MKRLRKVLKKTGQSLVIFLITLLLAEVAFRVYHSFQPSFVFYDTSYNRYRGKSNGPNYDFQLNSQGFNDVEFAQKGEGTYRIVALGDSFAFGIVPYPHNYLTLLEENLSRDGRKIEVLNMGIPAIGTRDYVALLINEGLVLKPDMVLVSFFIGNDFYEEKGRLRKLISYSYVATFINYLIVASRGTKGRIFRGKVAYDDSTPTTPDNIFINLELERSEIFRRQNTRFPTYLAEVVTYLSYMKQICDARNIALAVILIPDEVQVNPWLQARVLQIKSAGSGSHDFDFSLPNRALVSELKERKIECLDLVPAFSSRGMSTVLYKPNDSHWNIAGNKLAAELIASGLFHAKTTPMQPQSSDLRSSEVLTR